MTDTEPVDTNCQEQCEEQPPMSDGLASPEDVFYLTIADDAIKQGIPRLNDTLGRLLTLSTALSGGAVALLKEDVCYGWWRVIAAAFFFLALACSAVGVIPVLSRVPHVPVEIKDELERVHGIKTRWVYAATGLISAGLFAAIIGAVVKMAKG
jgi:hypothetical protein